MGKGIKVTALAILLCSLLVSIWVFRNREEDQLHRHDDSDDEEEEKQKKISSVLLERLNPLFSRSILPPTPSITYWNKAKTLLKQTHARLFHPNPEGNDGKEAVEKMKEAVAKSLEESKSTVEDSAKSAAKVARDTVHKAAEKVMKKKPITAPDSEL